MNDQDLPPADNNMETPLPCSDQIPTEEKTRLELEIRECKDKNLRLMAEMENARKRMQKEKNESIRFVIENTAAEFLPILDTLENALKFAAGSSPEIKSWASGFQMILTQFKEVLHSHGIIGFHAEKGTHFDPHYHEAMELVETGDYPDNTIIEEFAKGYKSIQRTIRPAKVKVSKQINLEEKENQNGSNEE